MQLVAISEMRTKKILDIDLVINVEIGLTIKFRVEVIINFGVALIKKPGMGLKGIKLLSILTNIYHNY